MTGLPSGSAGKTLALGTGLIAFVILYLAAIAPLLGLYQSQAQTLQLSNERAEHLRHAVSALPQLREAAERLAQKNKNSRDLLLAGPSDALAAATIQSAVKTLVTEDGGSLTSVDTLPPQSVDGMRRIGIRVSFSTALPQLASVLRKVETSRPALFVDNFDVHARSGTTMSDSSQQLTVALDIYGFRS